METHNRPLFRLRGLKACAASHLVVEDLCILPGEAWGVLGETGAGMEVLAQILSGDLTPVRAGECVLPSSLGLVSFARQQERFERELRNDDTDFINHPDPGTPAGRFLSDAAAHAELVRLLRLEHVLDRGYRYLSSGEALKIGILSELSKGAQALTLEHPFDGLDVVSCRELSQALARLHQEGLTLILLLGDLTDLPPWCTHLALLQDGLIHYTGPADVIRALMGGSTGRTQAFFQANAAELRSEETEKSQQPASDAPLVQLKNGFARYGEVEVFSGLNLSICPGEHTLITGPNGCGKSTLVQLLTGDHPLCYQNDLTIFGQRRGSGETIWDVKRQMGIVSNDLHRSHRINGSALAVVLSGLFDSIGLYRHPTAEQRELGSRWLSWLGLQCKAKLPFRSLSYGEQRLVMLARALIKKPRLLLLDEATQGLDRANRKALLDFLEQAAEERLTTIVYISHRQDEQRPFFRQHLEFQPEDGVPFRVRKSGDLGLPLC